nr:MAG TPA: hypothetical protein [Inoviridae sp.]
MTGLYFFSSPGQGRVVMSMPHLSANNCRCRA